MNNKLFSKTVENKHIIYRILGIKPELCRHDFFKRWG